MELLDLTGDSDGENDVLVASPPKGTAKAGGLSSSARSFGVSARVGGRAGPAKEMLDYAVNSKCHLKGDKKRELGGGSASRSFSASFELPAGALNNTSEASRKKPKLAMLDTAPSTSAKLSRSSSSSPASTASPLSPATASYANLNPLPISSRPSQRSFVRASTSVSAPLPFPSLTLVNCKPLSGNLPGDDLRYSVEDLFGDGGATNERAIVTTMGLQLPYVTNQITGKGRTVPTLFVYHRLEQGDVKDYKKGDVVLHQAKADKGLVSMHGKLVVLERRARNGTRYLRICTSTANLNGPWSWASADNALLVQDFPRLPSALQPCSRSDNPTHTPYSRSLLTFIESLGLPTKTDSRIAPFLDLVASYDFTASDQSRLVHSLSRSVKLAAWDAATALPAVGGLSSLARAVSELRRNDGVGEWTVEALGSSLNPLDSSFLRQLYAARQGVDPFHIKAEQHRMAPFSLEKIKVVYPCLRDVEGNEERAKYTYHYKQLAARDADKEDLRSRVLHRSSSKSGRHMHTKLLLVLHTAASDEHEAFLYYGSHNVTSAAWGKVDKQEYGCRQFELGAVIRLASPTAAGLEQLVDAHVPYHRPLVKWGAHNQPYENPRDQKGGSARGR